MLSDVIVEGTAAWRLRERLESLRGRRNHFCDPIVPAAIDAAKALVSIRDERLFREQYASFEEYCRHEWGLSGSRLDRMLAVADETYKPPDRTSPTSKAPRESCVYFIECVGHSLVKIGVATNVVQRLTDLKCACPFELRILATIPGSFDDEGRLHSQFSGYHVRGEWFRLEGEVAAFVEGVQT